MEALTFIETRVIWAILAATVISIGYAMLLRFQIGAKNTGTETLQAKGSVMTQGILAYRKRHLATMIIVIIVVALLLGGSAFAMPLSDEATQRFGDAATLWIAAGRAGACLAGALIAYAISAIGLQAAATGTIGGAVAAQKGYAHALQTAYRSGMVSGLLTIAAGVLSSTLLFLLFVPLAPEMLLCFALGGASIALCNRIGGSIYTKATTICSHLAHTPPKSTGDQKQNTHNITTMSHIVSTHINHCAGTLTDVLQSFAGVLVAALFLGLMLAHQATDTTPHSNYIRGYALYPLVVAGIGVLAAIIGNTVVRTTDERRNAMAAINRGFHVTVALCIGGFAAATPFILTHPESKTIDWRPFLAVLTGSILSILLERIGTTLSKVYFNPYKQVNRSSLLANLVMGREASAWGIVTIIVTLIVSFLLYANEPIGLCYSIALTGLSMLTLTGNTVTIDSFRPIARTASALGTMSELDKNARNTIEDLDFAGSMTSAVTRGITIGASVLGSIALAGAVIIAAYNSIPQIADLMPMGIVGFVIGSIVPILLLVLIGQATSTTAIQIMHASETSTPATPANLATNSETNSTSIATPSLHIILFGIATIALGAPIALGYALGNDALIGYLVGSIVLSQLIIVFTANPEQIKRRVQNATQSQTPDTAAEKTPTARATDRQKTERELLTDLSGPSLHTLILMTHLVALLIVIL